jgi:RNA recognition motif-containing protein
MNIFVGNISFSAEEEDIYKAFADFGSVTGVVIVKEKNGDRSRGFGFVEMPDEKEALSAIAGLHGKDILGRPVNVMPSSPRKPGDRLSELGYGHLLKRTGKYKQGRRSVSYVKKCVEAGNLGFIAKRKPKKNLMRWRKNPRRAGNSKQK